MGSVYARAEEQAKLAYMSVKTEIMMQKVSNSGYNAQDQENGDKLAALALKDLTGTNSTNSEWTKCEYNTGTKTIDITYTNSVLKKDAISAGVPKQNGEVNYQIIIDEQDARLEPNTGSGESSTTTYEISITVNNGTYSGATSIAQNGTATVTISASNNYALPSTVTVTGATQNYDSSTGILELSNPTENVTITATCTQAQNTARANITPAPTGSTYTEGQEVTFGNEKFFVISDDGTTVKLLAKYCLNQAGTEQLIEDDYWYGSEYFYGYSKPFSKTTYWSDNVTSSNSPYDLQTESMISKAKSDGDVEVLNGMEVPNAIVTAINYGAYKGVTGRLMTYSEAYTILSGTNIEMKSIMLGCWSDGTAPSVPCIDWWLGDADGTYDHEHVFAVKGLANGNVYVWDTSECVEGEDYEWHTCRGETCSASSIETV